MTGEARVLIEKWKGLDITMPNRGIRFRNEAEVAAVKLARMTAYLDSEMLFLTPQEQETLDRIARGEEGESK